MTIQQAIAYIADEYNTIDVKNVNEYVLRRDYREFNGATYESVLTADELIAFAERVMADDFDPDGDEIDICYA